MEFLNELTILFNAHLAHNFMLETDSFEDKLTHVKALTGWMCIACLCLNVIVNMAVIGYSSIILVAQNVKEARASKALKK
jgi:hypothetical protein